MDIVVHMDSVASLAVLAGKTVVDSSVVFPAIDSGVVLVVFDGQIVGDLNTMNLLMGRDVFEVVCRGCDHSFGLLAFEIDIDHGIDLLVLLVVMLTFD